MVTIKNYHLRESKTGKPFVTLELQGDVEMVQSMETGRFYATARRCSISSTFDEQTAQSVIGTTMPGKIVRQGCEQYEYAIPESGEVIRLAHRWEYQPDEKPVERTKIMSPLLRL
jgi:hypothetical protein